jgi:uracil-DNA glycosylase
MSEACNLSLSLLPSGEQFCTPIGWEDFFRRYVWDDIKNEAPSPESAQLLTYVRAAYRDGEVYPPPEHLFRAFCEVPFSSVRVVILGQDPYHEPGQAHGLSFSVPAGVKLPPSLRNIYKELCADLGLSEAQMPTSGDLSHWAKQGVLLLNSVLTVPRGMAAGHRGRGWEAITDAVLRELNDAPFPVAFILWGKDARAKKRFLTNPDHLVLESEHPSPLSAWRGFWGSKPFSATNAYLRAHGCEEIRWIG